MTITLTPEMRLALERFERAELGMKPGREDRELNRQIALLAAVRLTRLVMAAVKREGERCRTT